MKRISWNRFSGKLPPNTKVVMRPSRFGNPFTINEYGRDEALRLYADYLETLLETDPGFLDSLAGFDLACSCPPDEPCHADLIINRINKGRRR
jgi:hypothetical protein